MSGARSLLCSTMLLLGCAPDYYPRVDAGHGQALFAQNCAACHGADGTGAGPASLGLGAPPPDLTRLSAGAGGTFPRAQVLGTIDGFYRMDHPESAMPIFGEGNLGPTVVVGDDDDATPIPAHLLALAAYLESIQK